jgi:RND family efflux transporter MFP subunit
LLNIGLLRDSIENFTVTAPISGIITSLPVKGRNVVSSDIHVATIHSNHNNRIEVMVSTNDIGSVKTSLPVELILRRRDGDVILTGVVTSIDSIAVTNITSKGYEERLVKVTVTPDSQDEFMIGHDVDVRFTYDREENKLLVPRSAIFNENNNHMVWIVDNEGMLTKTMVQVGKTMRQDVLIISGISEGDVLVTNARASGLNDGMRVIGL